MKQIISQLEIKTLGEGFTDLTPKINNWISEKEITQAILVISTQHTSCSLIINENADPNVLKDLASYMKAIVPEVEFSSINQTMQKQKYLHADEGVDDMPAHIRTMLTSTCLSLSINESKLVLGTWQAIYLWEHRYAGNRRHINLHAIGEVLKSQNKRHDENINYLLAKTDPSKINKVVSKNLNPSISIEDDCNETNRDLLIDRIHDLTDTNFNN